jgi:hypothetical protein
MMKRIAVALALALAASHAHAWEAATTHAGLAEQAALSSRLHKRLVAVGFEGGLFELLTIPPADAPALIKNLRLLSPSHGAVPDGRGRQTALAWIAAGASLADIPAQHAANHFFDPLTGRGWQRPARGLLHGLSDAIRDMVGRLALPDRGMPAVDWIVAKDNPFSLAQFHDQYAKAIKAATPGERSRHMAAALVAAGGLLHVLADVGSPSRVRGDTAAHFTPLGGGPDDLGSRFERIAALAYGRLGVPGPSRIVTRQRVRDYFSAQDGSGLADVISRAYFSPNTLPEATRVAGETRPRLVRPEPSLPARMNLMAASRDEGTTLRAPDGTCLARYKVESSVLTFHLDDDCMLEQAAAILPEVAAYGAGLLDFLLRGELVLSVDNDALAITAEGLGAGELEILVEDNRGVRTSVATTAVAAGASPLARMATLPAGGARIVAVFRGVDAGGEPIVAGSSAAIAAR